jgi:microcystin-dependent protein
MDPFIGEIRLFGGNFPPRDWAMCNGQLMQIRSNTALFSLLGTMYGGDGINTFALPNLMDSVPIGMGAGPGLTPRQQGEMGGSAGVTLTQQEMPGHTHQAVGVASNGDAHAPVGAVWAQYNTSSRPAVHANVYGATPDVTMAPTALAPTGNSQPHNNMQPYMAMNFIIALTGIFPQRP